jgi:hypothetical protein
LYRYAEVCEIKLLLGAGQDFALAFGSALETPLLPGAPLVKAGK